MVLLTLEEQPRLSVKEVRGVREQDLAISRKYLSSPYGLKSILCTEVCFLIPEAKHKWDTHTLCGKLYTTHTQV